MIAHADGREKPRRAGASGACTYLAGPRGSGGLPTVDSSGAANERSPFSRLARRRAANAGAKISYGPGNLLCGIRTQPIMNLWGFCPRRRPRSRAFINPPGGFAQDIRIDRSFPNVQVSSDGAAAGPPVRDRSLRAAQFSSPSPVPVRVRYSMRIDAPCAVARTLIFNGEQHRLLSSRRARH